MQYRLRTLLIVMAGLALLECGLILLLKLELPGGILTWVVFLGLIYYVIPIAFLVTLAAVLILADTSRST